MAVIGSTLLLAYSEADSMTITGSSAASTMPVSYLQKMQPTDVCRFNSLDPRIVVDRGSARADSGVKMRGLYLHRVFQGSLHGQGDAGYPMSARVRTATTEADLTADPAYDSGSIDFFANNAVPSFYSWWPAGTYHNWFFAFPDGDGLDAQWLRIDLDLVGDSSGYYVDVSRLIVIADDTLLQPETNVTYPITGGRAESVQIDETPGGVRVPSPSYGRRKVGGSWGWLTADEAEQAKNFIEARGLSRDVLCLPLPQESTGQTNRIHGAYGLLTSFNGPSMNSYPETSVDFEIEELR